MDGTQEIEPGGAYGIDELAAKTGVPSRTIRFYQAKGVLPPPAKRGRVAVYDDRHVDRLQVVSELQDKGLRLRAIKDLVSREEMDAASLEEWLGVGERLSNFSEASAPTLVSEDELRAMLGSPRPGFIAELIRRGAIERHGEGSTGRFLVSSPELLRIAMDLDQAGIDLETAIGLHDILERRLGRTADQLVDYAVDHLGKGFGTSAEPKDVLRAVESLLTGKTGAAGVDAIRIIFIREIDRAIRESIQQGKATRRRRKR